MSCRVCRVQKARVLRCIIYTFVHTINASIVDRRRKSVSCEPWAEINVELCLFWSALDVPDVSLLSDRQRTASKQQTVLFKCHPSLDEAMKGNDFCCCDLKMLIDWPGARRWINESIVHGHRWEKRSHYGLWFIVIEQDIGRGNNRWKDLNYGSCLPSAHIAIDSMSKTSRGKNGQGK